MRKTATETTPIHGWHAHIYYTQDTKQTALKLREWIGARFPTADLGRWHDEKVGPHPESMYQIAFPEDLFPTLTPFIAMNRMGLTVLLHPESGRPKDDHIHSALWMGAVLPLDASVLPETDFH